VAFLISMWFLLSANALLLLLHCAAAVDG